jgi:arsenate reductase (thioredoxin)
VTEQLRNVWPGHPLTAHWGMEDPAAFAGIESEKLAGFFRAFRHLQTRVSLFLALPIDSVDASAIQSQLKDTGRQTGASRCAKAAGEHLLAKEETIIQ